MREVSHSSTGRPKGCVQTQERAVMFMSGYHQGICEDGVYYTRSLQSPDTQLQASVHRNYSEPLLYPQAETSKNQFLLFLEKQPRLCTLFIMCLWMSLFWFPTCPSLIFGCCDPTTKSNTGRKGFTLVTHLNHNPSLMEVRAGTRGGNMEAAVESLEKCCLLAY